MDTLLPPIPKTKVAPPKFADVVAAMREDRAKQVAEQKKLKALTEATNG